MTDPVPADDATLFPKSVGERLREAREAQGVSLAEIAARTRVPLRQLEAIEADNYSGLPSVTYAVGFAKAYARAVGADEVAIARDVRAASDQTVQRTNYEAYEIDDPKRTPSGGVLVGSLIVVALLLVAVALWYGTSLFRGDDGTAAAVTANEIAPQAPVEQTIVPAPTTGQVVLTATDEVWMRVYDAAGKTLFQNTLKPGERYEVPSDANGPMINVGRPDKLQVTLNGSAVPALGDGRLAINDVGVSAAALTGRSSGTAPAPAPTAPAAGSPGTRSGEGVPPAFRAPAARPQSERRTAQRQNTPDASAAVTPPPGVSAPAPAPTSAPTP
ncbi:helix-turn-helix domain-containing protein [Sphingomonas sp. PB4P5]|uniref:helix-turn-helix domain-containing protein n=1 Tax=Parasphingomonas puruogangriensis TaxID=3096155 RepID=UPI002FCB0679